MPGIDGIYEIEQLHVLAGSEHVLKGNFADFDFELACRSQNAFLLDSQVLHKVGSYLISLTNVNRICCVSSHNNQVAVVPTSTSQSSFLFNGSVGTSTLSSSSDVSAVSFSATFSPST